MHGMSQDRHACLLRVLPCCLPLRLRWSAPCAAWRLVLPQVPDESGRLQGFSLAPTLSFIKKRTADSMELCQDIIHDLERHEHSFVAPLTKRDVPEDYWTIIKRPMDLGTIKDNLNFLKYTNLSDFRRLSLTMPSTTMAHVTWSVSMQDRKSVV